LKQSRLFDDSEAKEKARYGAVNDANDDPVSPLFHARQTVDFCQ
jgi:hypothetical protein